MVTRQSGTVCSSGYASDDHHILSLSDDDLGFTELSLDATDGEVKEFFGTGTVVATAGLNDEDTNDTNDCCVADNEESQEPSWARLHFQNILEQQHQETTKTRRPILPAETVTTNNLRNPLLVDLTDTEAETPAITTNVKLESYLDIHLLIPLGGYVLPECPSNLLSPEKGDGPFCNTRGWRTSSRRLNRSSACPVPTSPFNIQTYYNINIDETVSYKL